MNQRFDKSFPTYFLKSSGNKKRCEKRYCEKKIEGVKKNYNRGSKSLKVSKNYSAQPIKTKIIYGEH